MKASVVIANFNNAKYVEDCINSITSQGKLKIRALQTTA